VSANHSEHGGALLRRYFRSAYLFYRIANYALAVSGGCGYAAFIEEAHHFGNVMPSGTLCGYASAG